jgi:hypothetical protein
MIPDRLKSLSRYKEGAAWLADVPKLILEPTHA